jgi:hypothetical protein
VVITAGASAEANTGGGMARDHGPRGLSQRHGGLYPGPWRPDVRGDPGRPEVQLYSALSGGLSRLVSPPSAQCFIWCASK